MSGFKVVPSPAAGRVLLWLPTVGLRDVVASSAAKASNILTSYAKEAS